MKNFCKRWDFISYFLITIIAFSAGFLFHRYLYYKWILCLKSKTDNFHYLGKFDDKTVYGLSFYTDPYRKEGKHYALKIEDDLVYWGTDSNLDGKIDWIKSFENGKVAFSSQDVNFDGSFDKHFVNTYKANGDLDITMIDMNADNRFDLKFIWNSTLKEDFSENPRIELFFEGNWVKGLKKEDGFYLNIDGRLEPVTFRDKEWIKLPTRAK